MQNVVSWYVVEMFRTILGLLGTILAPFWGSRMQCRKQLRVLESHRGAFEDRLPATKASNSKGGQTETGKLIKTLVVLRFLRQGTTNEGHLEDIVGLSYAVSKTASRC